MPWSFGANFRRGCGEHQDRHGLPGVAPATEERQAIHFRRDLVEDNGVVALVVAKNVGALTVDGVIDGIACAAKSNRRVA